MSRLETNLADGEAIQFSFRWNDGQEADQDAFMRMAYGSAAYYINSLGTSFGGMTAADNNRHRTFDIALGKDLQMGAFTGKVYDFAFVREGTTLAMYGKHGGAAQWKLMATATIAADNTDTTFKFGFGTKYGVAYNYSIFNASKVTPSAIKDNSGAVILGSHGSVDKNADGSWSLWGSLSNIGTAVSACSLATGAYDQTKYNMTDKRVVVETDFSMGTGHYNDNLGLMVTSSDGGKFMLGFFQNRLAIQLRDGNGYGSRIWNLKSTTTGVDYWNEAAMFKFETLNFSSAANIPNVNYRTNSAHLRYELEGRYVALYVDGVLAFAGNYVQIMGNYTGGENGNANTVEKAEAKAPKYTNVQFGFFGNHEMTGQGLDYAAENFKVTLVDPTAENALADAKANTIAKINAINVEELSPAGKEYYEANKQTVIDAINNYVAVEGESLTQSVEAFEEIAAPVLITNKDYTVHIVGYGKVKAKWGTTLASLVEGKTVKSASSGYAFYYNTDGKWNIAEGATVKEDNIYITPNAAKTYTSDGVSSTHGGYIYVRGTSAASLVTETCDINNGTLIMSASVKMWSTSYLYKYKNAENVEKSVTVNNWQKPVVTADDGTKSLSSTARLLTQDELLEWCEYTYAGTTVSIAHRYSEGIGFGLTDPATGKTIRLNGCRGATAWLSTGSSDGEATNGWGRRITPPMSNMPNWSSKANAAVSRATAVTMHMKVEISGDTWKYWIGTDASQFTASNANITVNATEYYIDSATNKTNGSFGSKQASESAPTTGINNCPTFSSGLAIPSIVYFGDGASGGADPNICGGGFEISNIFVKYVPKN